MADLDPSDPPTQTLSIPSLLLLAALSALAVRYFFFSPSSSSTTSSGRSTNSSRSRTANPADVERVAHVFPQVARRDIMWDLQQNGGSVQATTERILRGSLDVPPPTFQPVLPPSSSTSATGTGGNAPRSSASTANLPPETIDLIKRYNLSHKISGSSAARNILEGAFPQQQEQQQSGDPAGPGGVATASSNDTDKGKEKEKEGWSNIRSERANLLQKRREEMILNARRKLEERDRLDKAKTNAKAKVPMT